MIEPANLLSFIAVVIALFLIPGPAVMLTITRTLQGGRQTGILAGLGIATGDFIHTMFAAIGLSSILMTSAVAFNIVKFAGAAYLIYLGIAALLEKPADTELPKVSPVTGLRAYRQAIMVEVLNPKTALFFLAFMPQFVHQEQGAPFIQFLTLGLIFVLLSVMYTSIIAISMRPLRTLAGKVSRIGRWSGKFAAVIYIGLGLKVALQNR